MSLSVLSFRGHRTLVALAACAVCMAVQAQSAIIDGSVSVGAGTVSGNAADQALFNQYSGLRSGVRAGGLLGIDYSLRDPDANLWVDIKGSNLLGDNRELGFVGKNPGSLKITANYSELTRIDPNVLNTSLLGAGSTLPTLVSPSILPGAGTDTGLSTKRTAIGLGVTKIISPAFQLQFDVKSENKEGTRALSMGYGCAVASGVLCNAMFPEPIHTMHSQVEARLSYAAQDLRVNVGYYGSFFRNSNRTLTPGGLGAADFVQLGLALAPDNQAHQLDLSGNYDFSKTTRGTFQLGWSSATQNETFSSAGLIGPVVTPGTPAILLNSPDAKVVTKLAKLGFSSRPSSQLSLLGDLRYEDRDDQTPLFNYNLVGTNHNTPNKKVQGKLQASWQFDSDYRGTLGADHESIDRGTATTSSVFAGISALRQKTDETTLRAELRRRLADDVSGALSVSHARRDGSYWLQPNSGIGATGVSVVTDPASSFAAASGAVFMPTLADRQRNKVKVSADWQANEQLGLQFNAEVGTDSYNSPSANGLHDTRMNQLSVDGAYALSDNWAANAYLSRSLQTLNQSRYAGTAMAFDNSNLGASVGITGKANSKVEVGASLAYVDDRSVYAQSPDASAPAGVAAQLAQSGGLPDTRYRQTALKMFAKYALEKKASVRVDLVHQRNRVEDWTWGYNNVPFTYSDGATMTQSPNQNVTYLGVVYAYPLP